MNSQITEMAKRFMVEQYGPCPSDHETVITERDRWDEKLGLVILALEFAEKERGFSPFCPKCGNLVNATGKSIFERIPFRHSP